MLTCLNKPGPFVQAANLFFFSCFNYWSYFDSIGLNGFQFIQDPIDYRRGYHTNMDTYERLMMDDMKHNAVIVAAIIHHTAMRDELLARKPLPVKK